ncbi:MAG TPA: CopG family transcriptional regulator [Alicycliphilus sp.]|nr:CopG family transcriptional regulator [Alicycliphilus sp.]
MTTTTIRIDEQLKARIGSAATQAGKTAHAFILETLTQKLDQVEQDNAFHALATERWARIRATGQTVAWDDTKAYLSARAQGQPAKKPKARKLGA